MRRALALLLAASALLAGCADRDEAPPEPTPEPLDNTSDEIPTELPDNRTGEFAGFKETNVTDSGAHDHDYWRGQTRVEIINVRAMLNRVSGNAPFVVMRPPEGVEHLVFEGTGSLEITLSDPQRRGCVPGVVLGGQPICTPAAPDPAPTSALSLQYLHGASDPDDWRDAGPATLGAPIIIAIEDPTWTDMPHSTSSLWVFRVRSANPHDLYTEYQVSVVAVRAEGNIPEWPGHPDFYASTTSRRVLDATAETTEFVDASWCCATTPDKLVSYGTKTLHVWVNISDLQGPVEPTHWFLYHHNASGRVWNLTDPVTEATTAENTNLYWALRIDDNAMDTPYATQSRWEFALRGSASSPAGGSCIGGCAAYTVKYTITAIATNEEVDDYAVTFPWLPR